MKTQKKRQLIKEKTQSCGGCNCQQINPPRERLAPATKKVNVYLLLEDALMLQVALHEACLRLNRLDRAHLAGKNAKITLAVDMAVKRIDILKPSKAR